MKTTVEDMQKIVHNSFVNFSYRLFDADGYQIDSSSDEEPLFYIHGHDQLVPGLEKVMAGKKTGEAFKVELEPDEAYGERDENMILKLERKEIPDDVPLYTGAMFTAVNDNGGQINLVVLDVKEDEVVVDANHPLAGKTITYDVEIKSVRPATSKELTTLGLSPSGQYH